MKRASILWSLMAVFAAAGVIRGAAHSHVVRGADELFWVPTLEQAIEMAAVTGRPVFLMGYSLVGDGTTYSKPGEDYCTSVF